MLILACGPLGNAADTTARIKAALASLANLNAAASAAVLPVTRT